MDTNIIRCPPDSPNRCVAKNARGDQCMNQGLDLGEGRFAKYCSMHGGVTEATKQNENNKNMYRIAKFGSRIGQLANHSGVKGLRDEIGILRMVLEERLNKCNDADELLLASTAISDLVIKIEKVVASCHKLEASMGQLLDKQQLIQFAEAIIEVISANVEDPVLLDKLAKGIESATEKQLSNNEITHEQKKQEYTSGKHDIFSGIEG
jgi:hypothetical protein